VATRAVATQFVKVTERPGYEHKRRWQAIAALEKAYQHCSWYLVVLAVDPKLDPVRSDPRFADLLHRMNLQPLLGQEFDFRLN